MHQTHVPNKGALACQVKLHTALEGEDHNHELQFRQELQPVEPGGSPPQSEKCYTSFQLQLQASQPVWQYK